VILPKAGESLKSLSFLNSLLPSVNVTGGGVCLGSWSVGDRLAKLRATVIPVCYTDNHGNSMANTCSSALCTAGYTVVGAHKGP